MKKIVFLFVIILLGFEVKAQIDSADGNWELVFFDDFTTNTWSNWDRWKLSHPNQGGGII